MEPIPLLLECPSCAERHIDRGEFATKPHHTHSCQNCGMTWRPAVVPTVGVRFLPGFKDAVDEVDEVAHLRLALERIRGLVNEDGPDLVQLASDVNAVVECALKLEPFPPTEEP